MILPSLLTILNLACIANGREPTNARQFAGGRRVRTPSFWVRRNMEGESTELRLTIEGSVKPLKFSHDEPELLKSEQARIIQAIQDKFLGKVTVLSVEENLANAIFVSIPGREDDGETVEWINNLDGVSEIYPSVSFEVPFQVQFNLSTSSPSIYNVTDSYLGAKQLRANSCLTGKNVRVAVIDTGIDYTHTVLGGAGTQAAYQNASASKNPVRDGLFPTSRVVDGNNFADDALNNTNPLDSRSGHGTAVANAIVAMAPDVSLIAARVCSASGLCPDYAIIAGLNYAHDKGADIVNLSLGQPFTDGYYHFLAKVIEETATWLGITIVMPSGNYGNQPFVLGGVANVANAIIVGATTTLPYGSMARFSSRGPGTFNLLKPDITAPGDSMVLADAGSGGRGRITAGTSFSSPIVAGAAAAIKQKCPLCSPFAVKSILMNNARRSIKYDVNGSLPPPVTWGGSGEVDINRAVKAGFWAYSLDEMQPSISLGLLDVTSDMTIVRTIIVTNLLNVAQNIQGQALFRDPADQQSGAMVITFQSSNYLNLGSFCQATGRIEVWFNIKASNVPANKITSSGTASTSPFGLDVNEFDGWIVLSSDAGTEVALPFHSILRKAAKVTVDLRNLTTSSLFPAFVPLKLQNKGAGTAQIDAYELLATSADDAEGLAGSNSLPADFRYIGYRTISGETCDYILEFAFQLWERAQTLANTKIQVGIDADGDSKPDFILANSGMRDTGTSDCVFQNLTGNATWRCARFPPDHGGNSGTIIIRACSSAFGIKPWSLIGVSFSSATYPRLYTNADTSPYIQIQVPSTISAGVDVGPGEILSYMPLGNPTLTLNFYARGLMLTTNGYRNGESTGAAERGSEALAIPFPGLDLPPERTPENLSFPKTNITNGPQCGWATFTGNCLGTRQLLQVESGRETLPSQRTNGLEERRLQAQLRCSQDDVPRLVFKVIEPTMAPTSRPSKNNGKSGDKDGITGNQKGNQGGQIKSSSQIPAKYLHWIGLKCFIMSLLLF